MEEWQKRVVAEDQELREKISRLETFMLMTDSDSFSKLRDSDKSMLLAQLNAMNTYSCILAIRIAGFSS